MPPAENDAPHPELNFPSLVFKKNLPSFETTPAPNPKRTPTTHIMNMSNPETLAVGELGRLQMTGSGEAPRGRWSIFTPPFYTSPSHNS